MKELRSLLAGIFAFFLIGWLALVAIPYLQLGHLLPEADEATGDVFPVNAGGVAERGKAVYISNGCISCHTQQIRPGHAGSEIARKWGNRQTVARDYLYEKPLLTGWSRVGQDLTNVGRRRPDPEWHYRHLYDPRSLVDDSIMPPYRFLFKTRKIKGQPSPDALQLEGELAPPAGYEVVPTDDARALVSYLLSLDRSYPLPESVIEAEEEEEEEAGGDAAPTAAAVSSSAPQQAS